jgi:ABC-type dipeptide/oligopeptide/nickel transport system permease subunit
MSDDLSLPLEPVLPKRQSPFMQAIRRLLRHRSAQVGLITLTIMILIATFAPVIAPFDPIKPLNGVTRRSPTCIHIFGCPEDQPQHIFGIDGNNRDLFSRVIWGSRLSLVIGFATVGVAIVLGAAIGAVAGFTGGWLDNTLMRFMDVFLAFPGLLLALAIVAVLGPGLINTLLAIALVSIPVYARIVRASVLTTKDMEFVQASKALGGSSSHLLFSRILPNAFTPLLVRGTLGIAVVILDAAALSFLGLGAEKPTPEWGLMLGEEKNSIFNAPHLVFFPGLAIMITVLAFNLIGDGFRDALDPRLAQPGSR